MVAPQKMGSCCNSKNLWMRPYLEKESLHEQLREGHPGLFSLVFSGKGSTCNARDMVSVLGSGRSPGEGYGNPLQYSCLENPHGQRCLVGYSPWGHKESDMTEWLNTRQSTSREASSTIWEYWDCLWTSQGWDGLLCFCWKLKAVQVPRALAWHCGF